MGVAWLGYLFELQKDKLATSTKDK